jgi:hypothetical protein
VVEENEKVSEENLRCEYDQALEIAHHSDGIIHEVTAVVWGANTLLLGFILEVPCESDNQKLVVVASIVGLLMSLYVVLVHVLVKRGQRISYDVCQAIEKDLPFKHKIHTAVDAAYPKWRPGWVAILVLSVMFVCAWGYVMYHAASCLMKTPSVPSDAIPQQDSRRTMIGAAGDMGTTMNASQKALLAFACVTAVATFIYGLATVLLWYENRQDRQRREKQFHAESGDRKRVALQNAFFEAWGYWRGQRMTAGDSRVDASQAGRMLEALIRLEGHLRLNGYSKEANKLGISIRALEGVEEGLSVAGVALGLVPSEYPRS